MVMYYIGTTVTVMLVTVTMMYDVALLLKLNIKITTFPQLLTREYNNYCLASLTKRNTVSCIGGKKMNLVEIYCD